MPPIALSAISTRTAFRTRWRLRGGVGVWSGLVWKVVSDMVIPYSMVSRAIVSARWLGPHGPLLGFRPFIRACTRPCAGALAAAAPGPAAHRLARPDLGAGRPLASGRVV